MLVNGISTNVIMTAVRKKFLSVMQTFALPDALIGVSRYGERKKTMSEEEKNAAFAQAATACRAAMYRVALGMLHSPADAEDAVSNAVIAAWTHLHRLREPGALPGYLMQCTIHACHAILRRKKHEVNAESMELYGPSETAPDSVWSYVHHLPEKYRVPLLLRYGEDWKLEEIARALRLPKGTVSARLSRALKMLKKELQEE